MYPSRYTDYDISVPFDNKQLNINNILDDDDDVDNDDDDNNNNNNNNNFFQFSFKM
jgi:hypothetical protein